MKCIFCHKDSSNSKSVEHIIPESLGNKEHFLPQGYVCDECNHNFAIKIERPLLDQAYFISLRFRKEILTKKGKLVKQKMVFPGVGKCTDVAMKTTDEGLIASFDDEEIYQSIQRGRCHKMYALFLPKPEYPNDLMSRFLAKCAYEYLLFHMGPDKYDICVREMLGEKKDVLKELREYARYGKGKFWQYNQRRIYPEDSFFINSTENVIYETLHEMTLFVKEYGECLNGYTEAEVYYVVAIGGIEYAICLSDPDISEYKKWIEQHDGYSPLENDNEKIIGYIGKTFC